MASRPSPPFSRRIRRTSLLALLAVPGMLGLLSACERTTPLSVSSRTTESEAGTPSSFASFSDVPVPPGAKMDLERSLVLGDREAWIGRLVMAVDQSQSGAYDFFFDEMPRFGWRPVTTVRGETSVLTYTRGDRVATVQIWARTISGSTVSVIVSPAGKPPRATTRLPPPDNGVRTAPLR